MKIVNPVYVLNFGSSDKCVPCLMDIEDFQAEVRWVAEAVGSTFEGFDFVVHTSGGPVEIGYAYQERRPSRRGRSVRQNAVSADIFRDSALLSQSRR